MLSDLYISKVVMKTPVDTKSYLAALPAVKGLYGSQGLPAGRNLSAGRESDTGRESAADRESDGGRDLEFRSRVTFFVGENGTGKSTLLEAIAVAYGFNPEGGSKNYRFATSESHSGLWENLTLVKHRFPKDGFFLRAESFYNVASYIDELDAEPAATAPLIASYGGRSLHR